MLSIRALLDIDFVAALAALAYGIAERSGLGWELVMPEMAMGFAIAALGRWYGRLRKARKA